MRAIPYPHQYKLRQPTMTKQMKNQTLSRIQQTTLQIIHVCVLGIAITLGLVANNAFAEEKPLVKISNHWVRASHPGQSVGAAYMTFESRKEVKLTHVTASMTKAVEVHEMKMVNDIMKMRQLESLTLHKGEAVTLKPGGLHLMLFDLTKPLEAGEKISFELCFEDKAGDITIIPLTTTVKAAGHNHH